MHNLLVTGGAGFIGSNFARMMLERHPDLLVVVYDKLTYAGNLANLADLAPAFGERFAFVQGDIADADAVEAAFTRFGIDAVTNFAAASHVDRSILGADDFLRTQIDGTFVLLEAARSHRIERYLQVSTDEVYGQVMTGSATETSPLAPRNPYSATKAGADLLALSYFPTHGTPVVVTRGSNTYGPFQYPEKLLPLFATNAIDDQPLPMYGDGRQVREWTHALDHCSGIETVLLQGEVGEVYNVSSGEERENVQITRIILDALGKPDSLIRPVEDRPGHDRRYSVDAAKLRALGWRPQHSSDQGLADTVRWYRDHPEWWRPLKSGEYLEYYQRQYGARLANA